MNDEVFEKLKKCFQSIPILDVKNVVGEPLEVSNECKVFPLVKISVGTVGGGAEHVPKKLKSKNLPFAYGTTSGASVEPLGFLVVRKSGQVVLTLESKNSASKIFENISNAFSDFVKKSGKAKLKKVKEESKNAKK